MMSNQGSGMHEKARFQDELIGAEKAAHVNLLDMIPQDEYEVVQGFYALVQQCYTHSGALACISMVKKAEHMTWLEEALEIFPQENTTKLVQALLSSQETDRSEYSNIAKQIQLLALKARYDRKVEAYAMCHATKASDLLRTDNPRVTVTTQRNPHNPLKETRIVLLDGRELMRFY
jgi:hypothetical protein